MKKNRLKMILFLLLFIKGTNIVSAVPGATVPFTTYEAEEAKFGGGASLDLDETIRRVSSEKSYVHLNATGEFIEFSNLISGNRLTLRYSIPKGAEGTLSIYKNDVHNQDIQLFSDHCYDFDSETKTRRYNEKSMIIEIEAGDKLRIQKDVDDLCSWYGIDLIDVESAPEPLTMPVNYLSIEEFGAISDDGNDDTQAIRDCVEGAALQGKGVWIPVGRFLQNTRINLPANVNMKGAGIWHTNVHNTVAGTTYSNDVGYSLNGGSTISNIKFTGVGMSRTKAAHLFRPIGSNEILENLWIQNVACVYGWSPDNGLDSYNVFRDSRVVGTYFDGVHWGDGNSHHNLVENVHFRGLGDDAVAQVNQVNRTLCHNNTARFNTVVASYWGRGMANIGGDSLTYTDNYISSTYHAGLMIATEALSHDCRPIRGFQFLRNTLHKCGDFNHNHGSIHFWLKVNYMKDVVIKDNVIEYGETEGIHIDDTNYGDSEGRTLFENNIVRYNYKGAYNNESNEIIPLFVNNNGFPSDYTGTLDQVENTLKVFPNPFTSRLHIQSFMNLKSVSLYNLEGRVIYRRNYNLSDSDVKLDLPYIPNGLYAVEIRTRKQKFIEKVIKR